MKALFKAATAKLRRRDVELCGSASSVTVRVLGF